MDWSRDCAGISTGDLDRLYGYEWQRTTVVQLGRNTTLKTWEIDSAGQWEDWLQKHLSKEGFDTPGPGLTLILARRTKQVDADIQAHADKESSEGSEFTLADISDPDGTLDATRDGCDFNPSIMRCMFLGSTKGMLNDGREPSLRILPFGRETFQAITKRFHTHATISRVISRSDTPTFSATKVLMGDPEGTTHPAYVYHARSSKVWKMDLALTATYFPHSHHTFGILFGVSEDFEQVICQRLQKSSRDAAHPLLIFGILVEAERAKHVQIIEETMNSLETKIYELSAQTASRALLSREEAMTRSRDRNEVWLDTAYLRDYLINWTAQLKTMIRHAEELQFGSTPQEAGETSSGHVAGPDGSYPPTVPEGDGVPAASLVTTNKMIIDRLKDIVDEYHDKIRNCSSLLDGMTMATQWSYSDTNVEIAMETSRDSRYMRSIALVTMIFLPGTFLASVFSMTFFDWFGQEGATTVSDSIWIYFVVAGSCTGITLGLWYYWTSRRPRRP